MLLIFCSLEFIYDVQTNLTNVFICRKELGRELLLPEDPATVETCSLCFGDGLIIMEPKYVN